MNLDEFEIKLKSNPHALSDDIRVGKIPFSKLSEWMRKVDTPPLINFSYLIHPDCTLTEFKKYFSTLRNDFSIPVYKKAKIFSDMDAIVYALGAKDISEKSIKNTFNTQKFIFSKLIVNPYVNDDFKVIYYELTGDDSYLPDTAKDIFIF